MKNCRHFRFSAFIYPVAGFCLLVSCSADKPANKLSPQHSVELTKKAIHDDINAKTIAVAFEDASDYALYYQSADKLFQAAFAGINAIEPAIELKQQNEQYVLHINNMPVKQWPLLKSMVDGTQKTDNTSYWANNLAEALKLIGAQSYREDDQLLNAAFQGMSTGLDAKSNYHPPTKASEARDKRFGYAGVGLEITAIETTGNASFKVKSTPDNNPVLAAYDGVDGIYITHINGQELKGLSPQQANNLLRGKVNSTASVTFYNQRIHKQRELKLVRFQQFEPSVFWEKQGKVGVIKISRFSAQTSQELHEILANIEKNSADIHWLMLDLRSNLGGLLEEGVKSASLFLEGKHVVVDVAGRHPESIQHFDNSDIKSFQAAYHLPMVVVVDGNTASSAEIMTAALQDNGRATVIGTGSLGKGSVQTVIDLPNGGEWLMTWALIYRANGELLDKKGITPDRCLMNAHEKTTKRGNIQPANFTPLPPNIQASCPRGDMSALTLTSLLQRAAQ
ncbi:MAG: S41 family peptidase [Alphaproteobacteria bacterium]